MSDFWIDIEEVDPDLNLRRLQILVEATTSGVITFGAFQRVADREAAVRWMKEELDTPVREIRLSKENKNPLQLLRKLPDEPRCCVQIYDLEDALPEVTGYINYGREAFLEFPHALVFWVGPHGLEQVARKAPDFWAWRSGVFDVRTESPQVAESVTQHAMMSDVRYTDRGDLERKASLYAGLIKEQLERDEPREDYIARLRERLIGVLLYLRRFTEAKQQAERLLEWALDKDESLEASAYHSLGIVAEQEKETDVAADLHQRALDIAVRLGDDRRANQYAYCLFSVAERKQDSNAKEVALKQLLEISKRVNDQQQTLTEFFGLGSDAFAQNDLDKAQENYQRALNLAESIDDRRGVASTLHQLGRVAILRRDLDAAESLLERSLGISQHIGDRYAATMTRAIMGVLQAEREDFGKALSDLARAHRAAKELENDDLLDTIENSAKQVLQLVSSASQREELQRELESSNFPPVWNDEA